MASDNREVPPRFSFRRAEFLLDKPYRDDKSIIMTKATILHALRRLGELAAQEGLTIEATIYGGVAMVLLFDSRSATKDVDAILRPEAEARRLAAQVAKELGLPAGDSWVESGVALFLSNEVKARESMTKISPDRLGVAELPGIRITTPNPRYLLAMKARALRPKFAGVEGDWDDLEVLIRHERIRSCDELDAIIEDYFPDYSLADKGPKIKAQVQSLIERVHAEDSRR